MKGKGLMTTYFLKGTGKEPGSGKGEHAQTNGVQASTTSGQQSDVVESAKHNGTTPTDDNTNQSAVCRII